jgi:hypothetical protein
VEVAKFTAAKKSTSSLQQCEVHVFFLTSKALSARNLSPLVKLSTGNFISHTSLVVRQFLASKNTTVIPHPPNSPVLAPGDFFRFPKMKIRLKGRRFDTTEEIQAESQDVLKTLTLEDFQGCMESWKKRWDRCIHAQGEYFEGDGGN